MVAIAGALMLFGACDVLGTSSADSIQVQLNEWAIIADPAVTTAGTNTFEVTNGGTEPHTFAVLLPPGRDGDRYIIIGELGELAPDESATLTVTLEEATIYELASLRVEVTGGDVLSDYDQGMRLEYEVE